MTEAGTKYRDKKALEMEDNFRHDIEHAFPHYPQERVTVYPSKRFTEIATETLTIDEAIRNWEHTSGPTELGPEIHFTYAIPLGIDFIVITVDVVIVLPEEPHEEVTIAVLPRTTVDKAYIESMDQEPIKHDALKRMIRWVEGR